MLNIDVAWTSEFAAAGWISARWTRDRFPLNSFLPPVVDTATYDGQLYAVPYVTNAGLLYYRKDILAREGARPPRTWAELERQARRRSPRSTGSTATRASSCPYEGLTVNAAEAVYSAGGTILGDEGARVTVDSAAARERHRRSSPDGVREGWIPREALTYKEEESRQAFQDGRLLFLRNWPYAYALASAQDSQVAGKFGAVPLPGPDGPGPACWAAPISRSAPTPGIRSRPRELIAYLTSERVQRQVLTEGALPPVRADAVRGPGAGPASSRICRPCGASVLAAAPRPKSPRYDQVSLAVQAVVHDAMAQRQIAAAAVRAAGRGSCGHRAPRLTPAARQRFSSVCPSYLLGNGLASRRISVQTHLGISPASFSVHVR